MIVVLTCERPTSYLDATLNQIDESARGHKTLLVDGQRFPPREGWSGVAHPRPVLSHQNKWTAWEAFRIAENASEDLCFFEDDLLFCKNAPSFIEDFVVPEDLAFVTFFSSWVDNTWPIGLWRHNAHSYMMAQALKFPLRTVRALVDYKADAMWASFPKGGFDEVLNHTAIARSWKYGIFNPGLVQHVGAVSAVGNGALKGARVARNFAGAEFDADNLRRFPSEFWT